MIKVTKNGITKEIEKHDLANYLAMGWKEVKEDELKAVNFNFIK